MKIQKKVGVDRRGLDAGFRNFGPPPSEVGMGEKE